LVLSILSGDDPGETNVQITNVNTRVDLALSKVSAAILLCTNQLDFHFFGRSVSVLFYKMTPLCDKVAHIGANLLTIESWELVRTPSLAQKEYPVQ
jgi:hypothetical protein